jgi:GDP-mannose transporter
MVGNLNKLPIAISGLVFFGDPVTFNSISAILIGKFEEREKKNRAKYTNVLIIWYSITGFVAGIVFSYSKAYPPQDATKKIGKK